MIGSGLSEATLNGLWGLYPIPGSSHTSLQSSTCPHLDPDLSSSPWLGALTCCLDLRQDLFLEGGPWPGGSQGPEPRAACLPAFGSISKMGRPSRVLPAVPDTGQSRPCLRSWPASPVPDLKQQEPSPPGLGLESPATPFVRMLQRGLQTFAPNCKASKEP